MNAVRILGICLACIALIGCAVPATTLPYVVHVQVVAPAASTHRTLISSVGEISGAKEDVAFGPSKP